jgi:hypothetical protein
MTTTISAEQALDLAQYTLDHIRQRRGASWRKLIKKHQAKRARLRHWFGWFGWYAPLTDKETKRRIILDTNGITPDLHYFYQYEEAKRLKFLALYSNSPVTISAKSYSTILGV